MKCSEIKRFRAELTRRLLKGGDNRNYVGSSTDYQYDQASFPQLPSAQRTTIAGLISSHNEELSKKLDQMNETMDVLKVKMDLTLSDLDEARSAHKELSEQVSSLQRENQEIKEKLNEKEILIKELLLPFCRDMIKFVKEKNTVKGRCVDESLHSHLEIYNVRLSKIDDSKTLLP